MSNPDDAPALATVAILALPEVTASVLFGLSDMFVGVGRDWPLVVEGRPGTSSLHVQIVSADGRPLTIANGVQVVPDASIADAAPPQVICIPEVFLLPDAEIRGRFPAEAAWLREAHARGAIIAAACSGALLMAEAGLLEGEDATTHWAYCDVLAQRHPGIRLHRRRALVTAGEGQRLVMAGGGTSWQDLALYLIARLVNLEAAMQMARLYLIDWHESGQQPFARLSASRQSDDAVITRCQLWVADHYGEPSPVAAMTRLSGLAERSFVRRFQQATGLSPLQYVHHVRLEEAKQLLEGSEDPIEAIAGQVGYEDAGYFARLFKREVNLTPAQYRRRFAGLREVLQQGRTG
ncbi:AraC family transcriptional regulator [Hydrogenophaga taeniospiralis CCUG 15921]|uniref:AraC family transcriptional regulator n=1 Tax=Hydrogenophaga taeniospiralis CCUG 15921 TaxID=1281780 RepID=A0A9X4P5G0_9BURK|nr:helix-turn-helix domain-containing protein [Hydrogenophaga taeniospiralis]MDG5976753.1 AraC family transcriptional regulator [Hydrogenophaga taeniospiralis CCUG 15921]